MNIGILGSGFIVPIFIENATKIRDYHIRAVWGRHPEKITAFKDRADYVTSDLKKILNDEKIDVIYVALPNSLHYEYARKALQAGKDVLLEKPFCVTYEQTRKLINYARKKKRLLFETIMTIHTQNYRKMQKHLTRIGDIRMIEGSFSQYSRRYDRFCKGEILPAFDRSLAGGALMDLGIYNIHYVCGLFKEPLSTDYLPNLVNGIDTSGILLLDYGSFKASLVNAKDSQGESHITIQGTKGRITCLGTASRCALIRITMNDGSCIEYRDGNDSEFTGMSHELKEFLRIWKKRDFKTLEAYQEKTQIAARVLEQAWRKAGLDFPVDD